MVIFSKTILVYISELKNNNYLFNISAPKIAIQITASSGEIAIAGENYNLTCSALGAEHLNPIIAYQWRKNNRLTGINSAVLSFAPARISDAGSSYSCAVTTVSSYLTDSVVISILHAIRIQSKLTLVYYLVNIFIVFSHISIICYIRKQQCQYY